MQSVIGTDHEVVDELTRPVHTLIQPAIATAFGSATLTHEDVGVLLMALGRQYALGENDEVAERAARLYQKIKGKSVRDLYTREEEAADLADDYGEP
jgi:hypothetical protein